MVISEEDLRNGLPSRRPRIPTNETHVVQVQNVRPELLEQIIQIRASLLVTVRRLRERCKRNIRQLHEPSHIAGGLREKTEHALPTKFAKLLR